MKHQVTVNSIGNRRIVGPQFGTSFMSKCWILDTDEYDMWHKYFRVIIKGSFISDMGIF
jgi:hypothetical protein